MALRKVIIHALYIAAIVSFAKPDKKPPLPEEQTDLKKLANASNYFGLNMYQQLVKQTSDNIFFSPLSISTAMGMLFEGARGKSQQELQHTLGYDKAGLTKEKVPLTFKNLLENLSNKDDEDYILDNANALYIDNKQKVMETFVKEAQDNFKAKVENVDFENDNENVVNQVNNFVNKTTHGKIPHFIDELDPGTTMFLLNAVHFVGKWFNTFNEKLTKKRTFYNDGDSSKTSKVPMMNLTKDFRYGEIEDSQVLDLPYLGSSISMIVILPNKRNGLPELEKKLNSDKINQILQQLYKNEVVVNLPKFKIEYSKDLSSDVSDLGAQSIFGPGVDLRGINKDNKLEVSQIQHRAIIEVNENGTEASAATGIRIVPTGLRTYSRVPNFIADHPFIFLIVDRRNGIILFIGRVTKL